METQPVAETTSGTAFDVEKAMAFKARLESQQNMGLGIAAGVVSALVGAILWAAITVATKYQIGWMAIGVGCLVGYAVRVLGKGLTKSFGIVGGVCSLFGCLLGNLLSGCGFLAQEHSMPVMQVVWAVAKTPRIGFELLKATFSPMDVVFYIIAVMQGYQFAFRRIKPDELATLAPSA